MFSGAQGSRSSGGQVGWGCSLLCGELSRVQPLAPVALYDVWLGAGSYNSGRGLSCVVGSVASKPGFLVVLKILLSAQ